LENVKLDYCPYDLDEIRDFFIKQRKPNFVNTLYEAKYFREAKIIDDRDVTIGIIDVREQLEDYFFGIGISIGIPDYNFSHLNETCRANIREICCQMVKRWRETQSQFSDVTVFVNFSKIKSSKSNNQASFSSTNVPMINREDVLFRSEAEYMLFEPLKASGALFFPLPLAYCNYNFKEPDYLICVKGKWAILEVIDDTTHPSATEDAKRSRWFLDHNVIIREYSVDDCKRNPVSVVEEFIDWLKNL